MTTIKKLEAEVENLKKRNKRVEADKAWETSISRKILIVIITYFLIVIFFYIANLTNPWINAIVPSVAFVLSTLTVPYFKRIWVNHYWKK